MVSTRSHEHTSSNEDLRILSDNGTPITQPGAKKRSAAALEGTTPTSSAKKHKVKKLPTRSAPTSRYAKVAAVLIPPPRTFPKISSKGANGIAEQMIEKPPTASLSDGIQADISTQDPQDHTAESEISTSRLISQGVKQGSGSSVLKPTTHFEAKHKKSPGKIDPTENRPLNEESLQSKSNKQIAPFSKASKATHKRFDGKEIDTVLASQVEPLQSKELAVLDNDVNDITSEDEAPETVTKVIGFEKACLNLAGAAKAADTQRTGAKQKRRERDRLLKQQAEILRKKVAEAPLKVSSEVGVTSNEKKCENASTASTEILDETRSTGKNLLPDLLPDDILAAEPILPPSISSLEPINPKLMMKKRRFVEAETKPPKDIKHGKVKIRVLEQTRTVLPPKASQSSRIIRESWLSGRAGSRGKAMMERRKLGGGFIRRQLGPRGPIMYR